MSAFIYFYLYIRGLYEKLTQESERNILAPCRFKLHWNNLGDIEHLPVDPMLLKWEQSVVHLSLIYQSSDA